MGTPHAAEIVHITIIQSQLTICISQAILFCTGAVKEFSYISVTSVPQAAHTLPLWAAAHPAVSYCPAVSFAPLSPYLSRLWHCISQEHCQIHGSNAYASCADSGAHSKAAGGAWGSQWAATKSPGWNGCPQESCSLRSFASLCCGLLENIKLTLLSSCSWHWSLRCQWDHFSPRRLGPDLGTGRGMGGAGGVCVCMGFDALDWRVRCSHRKGSHVWGRGLSELGRNVAVPSVLRQCPTLRVNSLLQVKKNGGKHQCTEQFQWELEGSDKSEIHFFPLWHSCLTVVLPAAKSGL